MTWLAHTDQITSHCILYFCLQLLYTSSSSIPRYHERSKSKGSSSPLPSPPLISPHSAVQPPLSPSSSKPSTPWKCGEGSLPIRSESMHRRCRYAEWQKEHAASRHLGAFPVPITTPGSCSSWHILLLLHFYRWHVRASEGSQREKEMCSSRVNAVASIQASNPSNQDPKTASCI